jgi:hypothetical protein
MIGVLFNADLRMSQYFVRIFFTNSIVTHSSFLNQNIEKMESANIDIRAVYNVPVGGTSPSHRAEDNVTSRIFTG